MRNRWSKYLLAVSLIVLTTACVAEGTAADDEVLGILGATIVDPTSHKPVANAAIEVTLVTQPGAEADGRTFEAVTGSLGMFELKGLPEGTVRMTASAKGYLDASWQLDIDAGKRTNPGCLALLPDKLRGRTLLIIEGDPCGATAELNGRLLRVLPGTWSAPRRAPILVTRISAGTHAVRANKDGYEQRDYEVEVSERDATRLLINLKKQRAYAAWLPGAAAAAIAAVSSSGSGSSPPRTYTIAGHITEQGTDLPIAGVEVRVNNSSTTTNAQGAYTVSGLSPGTYEVTPELDPWTFAPQARSVTVNSSVGNVLDADFVGSRPPDTFSICGTVRQGEVGLGGVGMTLEPLTDLERARPNQTQSVTTGDDGSYCFDGLSAGRYRVYPTLAEYSFAPSERTPTVNPQLGSATEQDFDATLNTYSISGTVRLGESGLSGVTITIEQTSGLDGPWFRQAQTVTTDGEGRYSFDGRTAGQYRVFPTLTEYTFEPAERTPTVNQALGNATGQDFDATPNTYAVSGTVWLGDAGLPGVEVSIEPMLGLFAAQPAQMQSVTTDDDGAYSFTGLAAGQYRVHPALTEYSFDPTERTPTVNQANGDATEQDFGAMLNTYAISGTVYLDGTGLGGVEVTLEPATVAERVGIQQTQTVTTMSDGAYSFTELPAGQYRVTPTLTEYSFDPTERTPTVNQVLGSAADQDFDATLNTYSISGTVRVGENGLGGVEMTLAPVVALSGILTAQQQSVTTAADGTYLFSGLPAGQYSITPRLAEYGFTPAQRTPTVNETAGDAINQDFAATLGTYSVCGTVWFGQAGLGEVEMTIEQVTATEGVRLLQQQTVTTDEQGHYCFTGLPAGQYRVTPTLAEHTFDPTERTPEVNETLGDASGQDFVATRNTYSISGTVYLQGTGLGGVAISIEPVTGVLTAQTHTTTTGSNGTYSFTGLLSGQYRIVPSLTEYGFTPTELTPTVDETLGDATDQDFVATRNTYSISGTVYLQGTGLGGVAISIEPVTGVLTAQTHTTTTGSNGTYSFTGLLSGQYRIVPNLTEYSFTPTELTPTVDETLGDASGQDFNGTPNTYSISGTVTCNSVGIGGITVVLDTVAGDARVRRPAQHYAITTTAADGTYSFHGHPAGQYQVSCTNEEYAFNPMERTPTVNETLGNATGQDFTATRNTYSISGSVVFDIYGLGGVTVDLEPLGGSTQVRVAQTMTTTTATDGSYSFTGLVSGQYRVRPSMTEYTFTPTERTPTVNAANGDASGQDFIATLNTYSISGTVTLLGDGLGGVSVYLDPVVTPSGVRTLNGPFAVTTTATDGTYSFTGLVAGQYWVSPALSEHTFSPTQRTPTVNQTLGNATNQDFTATVKTYSISGTVSHFTAGLGGVSMSLTPYVDTSSVGTAQTQTVTTASDGTYSFTGLVAGQYRVWPTLTEYTFNPTERTPTVNEGLGDATNQDFTATQNTYSITGTITLDGDPFSNVLVSLEPATGSLGVSTAQTQTRVTMSDGQYYFTGLPPGQYRVWPTVTEYTFDPSERTPTVNIANGDATDQDFDGTLSTYSISGTITLDGDGLGSVPVYLDPVVDSDQVGTAGTAQDMVLTANDGTYSFTGLLAGQYRVWPILNEYGFDPTERTPTVNEANGDATGQDFAATPDTYSISGTLYYMQTGEETLPGFTVGLSIVVDPGAVNTANGPDYTTTADENGVYTFTGLPAGQYRVAPAAYYDWYWNPNERTPTVNSTLGDATDQDFTAGHDTPSGYIEGQAYREDGEGALMGTVITARLSACGNGGPFWTGTADHDGMYFIFVPFGGYTLTPALSGWTFEPTTRNVDVNFANSSVTDQDFDGTEDSGGAGPAQAGFVTSLACIQTRAGTAQISFGLTANASVTAEVLNIAGRRVRLIATDQPMDAGIGTLLWDGRNSSGAVVPSGAYIVRLTARGASGTQSQAMARVNISR